MTLNSIFKPIICSRSLFLLLIGGLTFVLQAGDNIASSAHGFAGGDVTGSVNKADRWMGPQMRPGIYGTRLAHLWDGTPEEQLKKMAAPKGDRLMLAYAPEMSPQSDALNTLERFDDDSQMVPSPQPRPRNLNKKPGTPLALLANFPKPVLQPLEQPAVAAQPEIKLVSLTPDQLSITQPQVSTLDLPYTLQIASVQTGCFPEQLVGLMKNIAGKFNRKVVVSSGFRDHGRTGSLHMHCAAADIQVPGISARELANFAKSIPGIGGVGTYCHPWMIHIDVGRRRDWDFGCRPQTAKKSEQKKSAPKELPKQTAQKAEHKS